MGQWYDNNDVVTKWLQSQLEYGFTSDTRCWTQDYASRNFMMTSSNGNIFRVTGPLCGEFTGPGEFPAQRPVTRSFDVFFDLRLNSGWVNNREAGNLSRHRGHYNVIVI